jgi:hypothetical protein
MLLASSSHTQRDLLPSCATKTRYTRRIYAKNTSLSPSYPKKTARPPARSTERPETKTHPGANIPNSLPAPSQLHPGINPNQLNKVFP